MFQTILEDTNRGSHNEGRRNLFPILNDPFLDGAETTVLNQIECIFLKLFKCGNGYINPIATLQVYLKIVPE